MSEQTMGYSEEDKTILASIHKKLNREPVAPVPQKAAPLPTPATPPNVPLNLEDPNPQAAEPAATGDQPVEGQPAEGQIPEGDAQAIDAGALPPTIKVTIKDDDGKDVEQELPVDEVRSGYMRHADYTRKTQALAKERAALPQQIAESKRIATESQQQFVQQLQQFQQFVIQAAAPELQGVDWNRLAVENPGEHVRLTQRANQVNATLAQIQNQQKRIAAQAEAQHKQEKQQSAVQARETLNREIPGGWNDDLYVKITKGAVNHYGYTPEEFGTITDARTIIMANDALKYRELVSGKPIAQQKVEKAPLTVRPGAAPTQTEKARTQIEKARDVARKSGSVDDAVALMQAKRARQTR